jgi:mobilome CxxCx(11)CxxC protein
MMINLQAAYECAPLTLTAVPSCSTSADPRSDHPGRRVMGSGEDEDERSKIQLDCWDNAVYAFGTANIFERRAGVLQRKLKWLGYIGLAGPLLVGLLALGFGATSQSLKRVIPIAIVVGIAQVLFSAWSLVSDWTGNLAYARESATANAELAARYQQLGRSAPESITDLRHRFDLLFVEDGTRRRRDLEKSITDRERCRGLRAGLRQFGRECSACKRVPVSMTPTLCEVCGKF